MSSSTYLQKMWTPAPVSNIRFDATSDGGLMITGTSVGSVKMLSDDERRLEELEFEKTVARMRDHRDEHARRKAWGAPSPTQQAWTRSTMAPSRRPSSAKGLRDSQKSMSPATSPAPRPRRGSGSLTRKEAESLVSQLEAHVGKLQSDLDALKSSQPKLQEPPSRGHRWLSAAERSSRMPAPVVATRDPVNAFPRPAVVVPPAYSEKVAQLATDHAKQLAVLERVIREKDSSANRVAELEAELAATRASVRAAAQPVSSAPPHPATESKFGEEFDWTGGSSGGGGDEMLPPGAASAREDSKVDAPASEEMTDDDIAWANRIRAAYLGGSVPTEDHGAGSGGKSVSELLHTAASYAGSVRSSARRRKDLTVPQPFDAEARARSLPPGIAKLRQAAEEKARQEAEESYGKWKHSVKEVPEEVKKPLLDEMKKKAEEERHRNHAARVAGLLAHEKDMQKRKEERLARVKAEAEALPPKVTSKPVPASCQPIDYQKKLQQEAEERKERVRQRSVEALKQSALPPRMQLHEAVKKAQEATGSGPAISTSASAQFSFKPEVRTQVPDFSKSHSQWTAALQAAKQRRQQNATRPKPFGFDSEERKQREAEIKAARQARAALNYASVNPTHPSVAPTLAAEKSRASGASQGSSGKKPRPGSAQNDAVSVATMKTTIAQQARMKVVQDMMRARLEAERKAEEEEQARIAKQKQINKEIAPVVQHLEAERQKSSGAVDAETKRRNAERDARQLQSALKAKVEAAKQKRPILFLRATAEAAAQGSRKTAELNILDKLKEAGLLTGNSHLSGDPPAATADELDAMDDYADDL